MNVLKFKYYLFALLLVVAGSVVALGANTLAGYEGRIVVKVLFPVGSATEDVDAFVEKMRSTVPKYEGLDGLISKFYLLSGNNERAGGLYLWESIVKANAWYTPEWYDYMKKAWGGAPTVEYLKAPIIVQNK